MSSTAAAALPVEQSADQSNAVLERNLAALGTRNADIAARIRNATPTDALKFTESRQDAPAARYEGASLCSQHRPLDEGMRLAATIDVLDHAAVVVYGFGLGYHARALAERLNGSGLLIVIEPDLSLARSVLSRIDHSGWLNTTPVIWLSDADDRAGLSRKLHGAESILAQGIAFLEHPASRKRLREVAARFSKQLAQHVTAAKTTLSTTLVRSTATITNLLANLDHYVGGEGAAELEGLCSDRPAVVVSAGPSLHRNMHLLAQPGVRDRCVIVAVQTTLKPLLEAGIKPHFVTALDFHEISKRFYDDIDPADVADVTLLADPKVHPVVLDSYPGPIRCCRSNFLDQLLGPQAKPMGDLPAGATVAHLALYVADHLGCNPIALVGQDLAFTDALYYAPGTAIHDVWAPELNGFNTIEMMEWQRIARHRSHLHEVEDHNGRKIFTDTQMVTYLQHFERDFAALSERGVSIIDATEGGAIKQHTQRQSLSDFLDANITDALPSLPVPDLSLDDARLNAARDRVRDVRQELRRLQVTAERTTKLLRQMLTDQNDSQRMTVHFRKLDKLRAEADAQSESMGLLHHLNQLGVFKRVKADRALSLRDDMTALERQRGELERDVENVEWMSDASSELVRQFENSERLLAGAKLFRRERKRTQCAAKEAKKIAALIPVDLKCNGLGQPRDVTNVFRGKSILQRTLERLGTSQHLNKIILLIADDAEVESWLDCDAIAAPVEIHRCGESPYPPEHRAIVAARRWADTCWRGGIGGTTIYDELLCPQQMAAAMSEHNLTAALLCGPDWPLVDVSATTGCDAVVARHLEHPDKHHLVVTQAPPGLCGCLVSTELMQSFAQRDRMATIGARLAYQPALPQPDPIAKDMTVQIAHEVRRSVHRTTFDNSARQRTLPEWLNDVSDASLDAPVEYISALDESQLDSAQPDDIVLELTTRRTSRGRFAAHPCTDLSRPDLSLDLAKRVFASIPSPELTRLTLDGVGDPLLHRQVDAVIQCARDHGVNAVHVRTELLCDREVIDRLIAANIDVVSVDLHADRAATYEAMMGVDRFREVLENIEYLHGRRAHLTTQKGAAALALPWIVPRLQRRSETLNDIDSFFDRWQHMFGCAVIESPPPFNIDAAIVPAVTPRRVIERRLLTRMTIFSDGSVPVDECDLPGSDVVGNFAELSLSKLWAALHEARRPRLAELELFRP